MPKKNPGLTDKAIKIEVPGPESKSRYVRERVASPGYFRPGSFRTIQTGEHRIIRGKRKGQREWETQAILHPESERRSLMRQARGKGIPVVKANPHDPRIASTILQQLGGNRFIAMTGAKNLMALSNGLSITLPNHFAKDNINRVHITLTPMDTYDLRFMEVRVRAGDVGVKEVKTVEDVHVDELRRTFTRETGLDVHLNPKKKSRNPSFACPGCGKAVDGDYPPGTYYCRGCRTALRVT